MTSRTWRTSAWLLGSGNMTRPRVPSLSPVALLRSLCRIGAGALLLAVLQPGCVADGFVTPEFDPPNASGTWREARSKTAGVTPADGLDPVGSVGGDVAGVGGSDADSVTYTLQIKDLAGFVHGTWIIEGDSSLPLDPWEAVVIGNHADGHMLTEYNDPRHGRCRLHGSVDTIAFRAEQRCESSSWEVVADSFTLRLVDLPPDTATASILGLVRANGEGVPDVTVSLFSMVGTVRRRVSDHNGRYAFTGLQAGSYTVGIAEGFDTTKFTFPFTDSTVTLGVGEVAVVTFDGSRHHDIHTSAVEGRVTIESEGLAGVRVSLSGGPADESYTATTGAEGEYSFTELRPGDYSLSIADWDTRSYEFAYTSLDVSIGPYETVTASFTGAHLDGGPSIRGWVGVEGLGGLEGITVTLSGADDRRTTTDGSGRYAFVVDLAAGIYTVSISGYNADLFIFEETSRAVTVTGGRIVNFEGSSR